MNSFFAWLLGSMVVSFVSVDVSIGARKGLMNTMKKEYIYK